MDTLSSKSIKCITAVILFIAVCISLSGCTSYRPLNFAKQEWNLDTTHVSSSGRGKLYVVNNKDTTMRFLLGESGDNRWFSDLKAFTIYNTPASFKDNSWLERYLQNMCNRLSNIINIDSVLFYSSAGSTLVVTYSPAKTVSLPTAKTGHLGLNDKPITWLNNNDWKANNPWYKTRSNEEIFTYVYFKNHKNQFYVVNTFNYGDKNIAIIYIGESTSYVKDFRKIKRYPYGLAYLRDMKDYSSRVVAVGFCTKDCIDNSVQNYRLGLQHKSK